VQQSNAYIIVFSIITTVILGGLLAAASVGLGPLQKKQVELDTKKSILSAVIEIKEGDDVLQIYRDQIESLVVDYQGNPVEQSHRPQKYRYYPTLGFGDFESAQRFCQAYDEVSNFLRPRGRMTEFVSLSTRRKKFIVGVIELEDLFNAA
jgi:Na+-transporting NADH:ubiquinone oxidoreductase subunit NqrC